MEMDLLVGRGQSCPQCKKFFMPKMGLQKYCCRKCTALAASYRRSDRIKTESTVKCLSCGQGFGVLVTRRSRPRKFCTPKCNSRHNMTVARHRRRLIASGYTPCHGLWVAPDGFLVSFDEARVTTGLLEKLPTQQAPTASTHWCLRQEEHGHKKVRST